MSAGTNAYGANCGFNQSGGAHFIIMTSLTNTSINSITTAATGSGGAVAAPVLALVAATDASVGLTAADVVAGKLLKDMGTSVVSSGRVFRKFAAVGTGTAAKYASSFGVNGSAAVAPNAGYGTFYLEVGREGAGSATPAPILRYF